MNKRSNGEVSPDGMDMLSIVLIAPIAVILLVGMLPVTVIGHLYNYIRRKMEIPR